jgi:hypothetical protein
VCVCFENSLFVFFTNSVFYSYQSITCMQIPICFKCHQYGEFKNRSVKPLSDAVKESVELLRRNETVLNQRRQALEVRHASLGACANGIELTPPPLPLSFRKKKGKKGKHKIWYTCRVAMRRESVEQPAFHCVFFSCICLCHIYI